MSEIKVSEMIEAEIVNDEDLIMIIQNGVNKKVPASKVGTGGGGVAGDTLPIGAIIDYDGESIPSNWEEVKDKTILYESETGELGNVTLNDSAENYDYIEIYYKTSGRSGSVKLQDFTNKNISLSIVGVSSTTFMTLMKEIVISGNTIRKNAEYTYLKEFSAEERCSATNTVYIYKVIGYKE